jgi:hypothetical protein
MKLPVVRVLPVVFALLMPTIALAEVPADAAPMGSMAAATHAGSKGVAKGRARPAKKPKAKAKAKRAKPAGKATKVKSGKKAAPKG